MKNTISIAVTLMILFTISACKKLAPKDQINVSGVYPQLAMYNNEDECGTGAVVPWEDRLWVITYGPHLPEGSSDRLYEINRRLKRITREESIGGTPANRMIHRESNQLFIGPYVIDEMRNVRVIPYDKMTGRLTGNARHLIYPDSMIYYATMEEGFYEVEVDSLTVHTLFKDARTFKNEGNEGKMEKLLPGAHGKGVYSGQGVLVYSNNGEKGEKALREFDIQSGALAEWDGKNWTVVRRNQFVEVTGPGGLYGNSNPETDPIWATGWDHKSIIVAVRDTISWSFFRLPKASHSYDGAHGWNTEWPRIRDVGTEREPDYLMTMHGMFWRFPGTFSGSNTAGIRPRSAYLKVIGDFARWKDKLVIGSDDAARKEFLNKRSVKGNIGGPGQSNSNLWFIDPETPDMLGPSTASGAVWLEEKVFAGTVSEPFLFRGWDHRIAWVQNLGENPVKLSFELDEQGTGSWEKFKEIALDTMASKMIEFGRSGEWIRCRSDKDAILTVQFSYSDHDERTRKPSDIFNGLSDVSGETTTSGLMYGLGNNRRALGISAVYKGEPAGYYELDSAMNLVIKDDPETREYIDEKFAIPKNVVTVEESSVLVIDDKGRRWRFPLGDEDYSALTKAGKLRIAREVATERDLFSLHGTFYELPAENADGFAKVRPIASHNFRIHDYASYRGMLVMTGIDPEKGNDNPHVFKSENDSAAIWAGVIDDLWKLGKPSGSGGPWKNSLVKAGVPSDPYLIGFYDQKSMELSHSSNRPVKFTIEVDPVGQGPWMKYMEIEIGPGQISYYEFPENFQARWIRFTADRDCRATTILEYK